MPLFVHPHHERFGTWPLGYIPYGGADFGEVLAVANAVGDGDDDAFYQAWCAAADRLAAEAAHTLALGHRGSASALFLRASAFYAAAYHPLYGEPVDGRLLAAFRRQMQVFEQGMALADPGVAPIRIPFAGGDMPGYLVPAQGRAGEVRPLLLLTNGYDATITDLYFASAVAASRRGYHCLVFDGPGQGAMLYERGIRLRPDWETVIGAVVDFALTQPNVDPRRIALSGWSLGGHLAPRAASAEHRLAACIADPGLWSIADGIRQLARQLGVPEGQLVRLGEMDQRWVDQLDTMVRGNDKLRWSVVQRGFWVHGVSDMRGYVQAAEQFTLDGRAEQIQCPTLLSVAAHDPLASGVEAFFDALRCPKQLLRFSAQEGAADHCEMFNRSLFNRRALDWLDAVMAVR